MPCGWISIDAMDVSGDVHLEVDDHDLYKERINRNGRLVKSQSPTLAKLGAKKPVEAVARGDEAPECGSCYGAETAEMKCCNTCKDVRDAYRKKNWSLKSIDVVEQCRGQELEIEIDRQRGEGCHVYGDMKINKVAGNIHFAPGHSFQQGMMHLHDLSPFQGEKPFDFSHTIHKLAFGLEYPGLKNPLDGHVQQQKPLPFKSNDGNIPAGGTYQYFLKVVPTKYTTVANSTIHSNQYSVTETYREPIPGIMQQIPGVFFYYDLSPVRVQYKEERRSFFSFMTSACAIIGGLFTISGIVDSSIYAGQRAAKKKMGIGKLS